MGTAFSFIHAADLHLDSPFRGMGYIESLAEGEFKHVFQRLRDCTFIALTRLIDLCLEEKVDFLLLAGDIYDVAARSLRAQLIFVDEMHRLAEAGIKAYIIHGNHDFTAGWRANLEFPETVHVFSDREVECCTVMKQGREIARVCGISYPQAAVNENLSVRFVKPPGDAFSIALLHANVGSIEGYDNYSPCKLEELLAKGFDYWALGHIHSLTVLHTRYAGVVYPGCHQGRSVREMGAKGCILARVGEDKSLDFEFRPTDNTRWQVLEVSINGLADDQALMDALEEKLLQLRNNEPGMAWVVRIVLNGRGGLHHHLKRPSYLPDLINRLRDRFARNAEAFIWPESIVLRTGPEIDKEHLLASQTLLGDFLQLSRQAGADPELAQRLLKGLQGMSNSHQVARYLDTPTASDLSRLLSAAEDLGLELLWEEDS